jgi:hypothetical protein
MCLNPVSCPALCYTIVLPGQGALRMRTEPFCLRRRKITPVPGPVDINVRRRGAEAVHVRRGRLEAEACERAHISSGSAEEGCRHEVLVVPSLAIVTKGST